MPKSISPATVAFTIAKQDFTVPAAYFSAGQALTQHEADALSQLVRENVRNNLSGKIPTWIEKGTDDGDTIEANVLRALTNYEFTAGKGGGARLSDEVRAMREILSTQFKAAGFTKGEGAPDMSTVVDPDTFRTAFSARVKWALGKAGKATDDATVATATDKNLPKVQKLISDRVRAMRKSADDLGLGDL